MKQLIRSMIAVVTIAFIQCMPLRAHADTKPSLREYVTGAAYIFGVIYVAHHLSPRIDAAPKKVEPFDMRNLISPEAKKVADDVSTAALKGAVAIFCAEK